MDKEVSDWSWVPARDWEWMRGQTTQGVHTYEGKLVWWERPAGPGGYASEMASEQAFDAFLANGAPVFAPEHVVIELRKLLVSRPTACSH